VLYSRKVKRFIMSADVPYFLTQRLVRSADCPCIRSPPDPPTYIIMCRSSSYVSCGKERCFTPHWAWTQSQWRGRLASVLVKLTPRNRGPHTAGGSSRVGTFLWFFCYGPQSHPKLLTNKVDWTSSQLHLCTEGRAQRRVASKAIPVTGRGGP
jgi:hypothetical protein